ncbi:MAG: NAD(P)-binding domain-containing protein [Negativicutes bacterium]|nr:NAD(P)-binding domain-containing protein [Negativicutes bacterium]
MKMKLYIEKKLDQPYLDQLEPYYDIVCHEVQETETPPQGDAFVELLAGIDVVISGTGRFTRTVLDQLPMLKYISSTSAGFDGFDVAYARERGVRFSNNGWAKRDVCAEHAIALILAVAKMIPARNKRAKSGQWQHGDGGRLGLDLTGKTLGIIGAGNIGQEIARKLSGFQMTVLYHNRKRNPAFETECGAVYTDLETLLRMSDVVTTNMPLSAETTAYMDLAKFKMMKPTAIYINISRGKVALDQDLLTALKEGMIWGAGIDVLEHELEVRATGGLDQALLKELFALENIVITPHAADMSVEGKRKELVEVVENAVRFAKGEPLVDEVVPA